MRWSLKIQPYWSNMKYRKGSANSNADSLSRAGHTFGELAEGSSRAESPCRHPKGGGMWQKLNYGNIAMDWTLCVTTCFVFFDGSTLCLQLEY